MALKKPLAVGTPVALLRLAFLTAAYTLIQLRPTCH
jgi:hypothetical protein